MRIVRGLVIVAGAAYLISLRKMSRKSMIVTSVLVSVIVAYFSYKGRSVSWVTETVMPLAEVATVGTEWGTEGERRFFKAIHEGEAETVRRYLQAGMPANTAAGFGMPPLYLAQMQNHPTVMMILIQHGADLNAKFGPTQRTALHDAALGGRIECIRLLLEAGADPNALNKFGRTPLNFASNPPSPLRSPPNSVEVAALLRKFGGQ